MENLIRSGALDCLDSNRKKLFKGIEKILQFQILQKEKEKINKRTYFQPQVFLLVNQTGLYWKLRIGRLPNG